MQQAPVLAHYSADDVANAAAAARQPPVQDHPAAASGVLMRAASPQPVPTAEMQTETSFSSLPESSRAILQQASLANSQQQQQQQQHILMQQQHQQQQQQQHMHSMQHSSQQQQQQHTGMAPSQMPAQPPVSPTVGLYGDVFVQMQCAACSRSVGGLAVSTSSLLSACL